LSAIALLCLYDWKGGLIGMLAAALGAMPIVKYVVPADHPMQLEPGDTLRVMSLNTWFRNEDPNRLLEYLETSGADLIVLQEISTDEGRGLHARLKIYPYAFVEGAGASDSVVLSRWPITAVELVPLSADSVSAIRATIDWNGQPITLIGAHLHWPIGPRTAERRNSELAGLSLLAQSHPGPLVMLGDFNITPWSPHFESFLRVSGLQDCAVGHGVDPTWPSQVILAGIRIDHCFASSHWRSVDALTGPAVGSDHRPMIVELELQRASARTRTRAK
jgi:endonuclease/exonuclease/phosphatase (EEP) superfamily protein YafD